jgi:hypothetical protein
VTDRRGLPALFGLRFGLVREVFPLKKSHPVWPKLLSPEKMFEAAILLNDENVILFRPRQRGSAKKNARELMRPLPL